MVPIGAQPLKPPWWRHLAEALGGGTWWRHLAEALGGGTWWRHLVEALGGGTWQTQYQQ
jgi:hypothetical protein